MIHEDPVIRVLSDNYLTVEFGDVIDLRENFRLQAAGRVIDGMKIDGVIEAVPHLRSLGIVFDRARTSLDRLRAAVTEALASAESVDRITSRLFRIPVWYDDPFSAALAEHFKVENNLEFMAQANGLTPDEVIACHTGTDFWIAAVGFVPGCFWAYPLDESKALTAPKYAIPRDRTPSRTVALAGLTTTIYPYPGPGGYQCIGRSAVHLYQARPEGRDPLFPEDGVLVRPGDRHRYHSVDALEYEAIRERVRSGDYAFDLKEEEIDVESFLAENETGGAQNATPRQNVKAVS
ncbi:carboxyltransferase domain-containing protein [Actinomadura sp. KC06]|uniref:5-oxoprolinase subunit B family protein n=1 Tax=Actinomadura sp. KC06 TaxID=2530369 RepID=UPI001A9E3460|nr:carboxyltransferase domain-containing protein [Actinomadura sp. KC06]